MIESRFYFKIGGEWVYQGSTTDTQWNVSSLALQYAHVYSWRVDTHDTETDMTTFGDTWGFTIKNLPTVYNYNRPENYDPDQVWGYNPDTGQYEWQTAPDITVAGGGRYSRRLVIVGHNCIYYNEM